MKLHEKTLNALLGLTGLVAALAGGGWLVGLLLGWEAGCAAVLVLFGFLAMAVAHESGKS